MEDVFERWEQFIDTLIEELPQIAGESLVWGMGLLLVIVFFVLYDLPQDKKNARRSITGLLRYALRVVLAFIEDLLAAVESVTGFVDVVRVILKGKLTDGVQFLLGNYAIIALSVASFFTTFNGLGKIMNNYYAAALVTFGIQVGILAMSSRLALDLNKKNQERVKAFKEIDYYTSRSKYDVKDGKDSATVIGKKSWQVEEKGQGRKIVLHSVLLILSMIASIYFSYVYFFEEHVQPKLAMDNYILTMNTISEITDDYTSKISEVHGILQRRLQRINQQIRESVDPAVIDQIDSKIAELENQISQRTQERETLTDEQSDLVGQYVSANETGNTASAASIEIKLSDIRNRISSIDNEISTLELELNEEISDRYDNIEYSDKIKTLEALEELDKFYTDPISYMETCLNEEEESPIEKDQAEQTWRSKVTDHFERIMSYDPEIFSEEAKEECYTLFNNYANLCGYYQSHGQVGFYNILDTGEGETWKEILQEVQGDITGEASGNQEEEQNTARDNELNNKSADFLAQMLDELGGVPDIVQWSSITQEEQKAVRAFSKEEDMKELYRLYRVCTDNVDTLELVILKWRMDPNWLLAVILFLAVFVDALAVILTLVKGTMHYENKLPRYRKLLHKIFIQDIRSEKDKWAIRIMQWAGGLGVAAGLLAFGFYYSVSGSGKSNTHQIVSLICFVSLGALISRIIACLYKKAHDDARDWKEEAIYKDLRLAWEKRGINTIDDLWTRMEQVYSRKESLQVESDEVQWIVQLLATVDFEDILKVLRPNARLLFRHIGVIKLKKRTWEYYFANQGLSSAKDYIQGWYDMIDTAYISYDKVKEHGMGLQFAVLRAEGLIAYFECEECLDKPQTPESDEAQPVSTGVTNPYAYYILSGRFLRILFELIMEAYKGTGFEDDFYIADDLADAYESEETMED